MRPRDLGRYLADVGWTSSPVPPVDTAVDDLEVVARSAAACTLCRLSKTRRTVVFGEGDPRAALMFIGEGPGADEDRTGRPFVGQAGQLLDRMIGAMGLSRRQVYITNIVKCRPPGNRDPEEDEVTPCAPYLDRQIDLIRPKILVALGKPASHRLTATRKPIGALRGRWFSYRDIPLMPVFHPAYLLRTPSAKRDAWEDLKKVMAKLATAE